MGSGGRHQPKRAQTMHLVWFVPYVFYFLCSVFTVFSATIGLSRATMNEFLAARVFFLVFVFFFFINFLYSN